MSSASVSCLLGVFIRGNTELVMSLEYSVSFSNKCDESSNSHVDCQPPIEDSSKRNIYSRVDKL